MKAYKASYNGVCLGGFKYEVGQTYEETDEIVICARGFHACYKMVDTLQYYPYTKDFVLFEVELLGEVIKSHDKVVTNKIKILRVVSPEEYEGFKADDRGNLIYHKNSRGYEFCYEYDLNNNITYYKSTYSNDLLGCRESCESWSEYDDQDRMICKKVLFLNGRKFTYNYSYDTNGNVSVTGMES